MTGPPGNRLSIDLGCASVNRNSWGGDDESLGENRSAYYPRDQSFCLLRYTAMGLVQRDIVCWSLTENHRYSTPVSVLAPPPPDHVHSLNWKYVKL